jgi:hypothetical protein
LTNVVAGLENGAHAVTPLGACVLNIAVEHAVPKRLAKLLAVLSVAGFWLLPLSSMVAIGAVSMTRGESG